MNSPITGRPMPVKIESRVLDFRKESFEVSYHFFLCEESGEQFTTTSLDELNMLQLYNQYRAKHNLPFPNEIRAVREQYGLPATKMSEILGFGVNSYRNYEAGEVPSLANARLIQLAADPAKFLNLVELSESLDTAFRKKLIRRLAALIDEQQANLFSFELQDYLLGSLVADEFSGYRRPDLSKLTEMVVFFSEKLEPWKTQLNKLLFYADFLAFKRSCFSISGAKYRAINMGPVPNNFNSIFEYMANNDDIDIWVTPFPDGNEGEQFKGRPSRKCRLEVFSELELEVLDTVVLKFKNVSTKNIIALSHLEKAWIENEKDRKVISYKDYAFDLSM
jgi:putative zinc finger/helix-turn-helix YgiT family protein